MSADPRTPPWCRPNTVAVVVVLTSAAIYLVTEHSAHLLAALPFLLFLACPLMHVFMHHSGHGGQGDHCAPSRSSGLSERSEGHV
jgi:hypothetical protein